MAKQMTIKTTKLIWCPVPIRAENKSGWEAGLKTSPWTCFHPYSSPEKNIETVKQDWKVFESHRQTDNKIMGLWSCASVKEGQGILRNLPLRFDVYN